MGPASQVSNSKTGRQYTFRKYRGSHPAMPRKIFGPGFITVCIQYQTCFIAPSCGTYRYLTGGGLEETWGQTGRRGSDFLHHVVYILLNINTSLKPGSSASTRKRQA
ncbi:hypothetical protein KIL84_005186 [Mauremys mutica]|uniref:Uncharacterized protein n=1 Tax=Mauremys mutica TaxID=74926 RepID=A0A9D3XLU9_9SAUR|nr:hypothetical protein KIL84_005186 [Mauremys mutica]